MPMAGFFLGFTDFQADMPLHDVAELLSEHVFGGISFIEKDVDEDHDLGTLTLARDFLGIQVDLVGAHGEFTIELGTIPCASVEGAHDVCNLSMVLVQRLRQLPALRFATVSS